MRKLVLVLSCLFTSFFAQANDDVKSVINKFQQADATQGFFEDSYGYAVFPSVGKGGLIIGGAYGSGPVYVAGQETGEASLSQVSIGFQFGGQSFSEIVFFKDQQAYDRFTSGDFEFSAQSSAIAVTIGANASTSTIGNSAGATAGDSKTKLSSAYKNGMAVFTLANAGLMVEAALAGQKFSFEPKA